MRVDFEITDAKDQTVIARFRAWFRNNGFDKQIPDVEYSCRCSSAAGTLTCHGESEKGQKGIVRVEWDGAASSDFPLNISIQASAFEAASTGSPEWRMGRLTLEDVPPPSRVNSNGNRRQ
jgi:hypothetical protein